MIGTSETPREAARRLASREIGDGYAPEALHVYTDAHGAPLYWRIRMKHPTKPKYVRPMQFTADGYALSEPAAPPGGKPLYLLHTLAADAGPVWIVEGEKPADALARLGVTVTTSGSADSVNGADWVPLAGRRCIIWPDRDTAGQRYATQAAERLHGLGCAVETIDPEAMGAQTKDDAADWLALHPDATAADLDTLPRMAEAGPTRTAPEPLRRPLPPPEPYPMAELGPILAPAAECLQRVIQAPAAVCGASLLAAASLAVQGQVDVTIDGRTYPASLWFLTVAESGERKSAVDAEAMRPARLHEKALAVGYAHEQMIHEAHTEQWNARRDEAKKAAKASKGEGLADALRALGPEPPPPLRPTLILADFTAEGVSKLLAVSMPSVAVNTDEAALVLGGHGMTKESTARTAATLCKLWDSGTLDRVRATEGAMKLDGRRLAVHLMAQPVIAERALSDDVLAGQGFLARCLLAWPEGTAGSRPYCEANMSDEPALIRYRARSADLFARPLPIAEGQRNELAPPTVSLSPEAFEVWKRFHNMVEREMAPGRSFATVKPWASKTPEQCLRIAAVLSVFEHPDARTIGAATIERAAELALWHLNEAARLAGTAETAPEVRDAEALLIWAHSTGRDRLHSSDALQRGPARIRDRVRFTDAMGELERAGWAHKIAGGAKIDGAHRKNVWGISPATDAR